MRQTYHMMDIMQTGFPAEKVYGPFYSKMMHPRI